MIPEILYEDNHIIAVNKRPSEIVQADKTGDTPLSENIKLYLKAKYKKAGNVFLGVIHRIDRPVSGVVLFAKTSKALERLNKMFREKEVKKIYWAVVKNKPPREEDHLVHFLRKDQARNISKAYPKEIKGSLMSELEYKVIANSDKYYLLQIKPNTGRHHQIRAQLASIGCPIKGDIKYGFARTNADKSIHLHARNVEFIHPIKDETVVITANPPNESLWNVFFKKLG